MIILIILNGCSTTVFLSRPIPPEMVLEERPARIVFSNRFYYQNNPGIKEKHKLAYKTAIDEFGNALTDDAPVENSVVIFLIDSSTHFSETNHPFEGMMPESEIKNICRSNNAGYLLTLDSLRINFEWEMIREEDPIDGSVSKTKDFYLLTSYYVTLYDAAGGIIKRTLLRRTQYYKSRMSLGALITILPNLDKARDKIKILAREAGTEYVGMFYPSIERYAPQKLHTGKAFNESNSLIMSREYDEAIRKLQEMEKTAKPGMAAKIRHNVTVATKLK